MKTETIIERLNEVENLLCAKYYKKPEPRDLELLEIGNKLTNLRKRLEREVAC